MNPLTKESKISRCAICDSKLHWAKHCQHRRIQNANIIETSEEEESENEYEIEDVQCNKRFCLRNESESSD